MMTPGQNAMKRQGAIIAQPPAARCHIQALPGARASLSGPWPNIPIYWGQRHPGSLLSHFMFLNNSNVDTHHLKFILATRSDKVRTKNKEKKESLLFIPNRFNDSPVRHYSSPLNDLHDLIFQRLTHFLVQSQNVIFYLLWERKETAKSEAYMLKKPTQQHSSPLSYITYTSSSQQCCRASKWQVDKCAWAGDHQNYQSPLPVLQDVMTAAIRDVFQEIGSLSVTAPFCSMPRSTSWLLFTIQTQILKGKSNLHPASSSSNLHCDCATRSLGTVMKCSMHAINLSALMCVLYVKDSWKVKTGKRLLL